MNKKNVRLIFLLFFVTCFDRVSGQIEDSVYVTPVSTRLPDVEVTDYLQPQQRWQTPASVGIITCDEMEQQSVTSLVPAMNTVPGVRMEVRSPYGVRNVKIYYNDFSLTDAGGNTYLNVLNVNDLSGVEILKGPDGSLFGANSGGVVLLQSNAQQLTEKRVNIYGGSYGLAGEAVYLAQNYGKHFWTLRQSYQRSDGYRNNSANYRDGSCSFPQL